MKYIITILSLVILKVGMAQHSIIPAPAAYTSENSTFTLNNQVGVDIQTKDAYVTEIINRFVSGLSERGISLRSDNAGSRSIVIRLNPKKEPILGNEGYQLAVSTEKIQISANYPAGVLYALETLDQLIPETIADGSAKIPGCTITDYPRFGWRGLMLDVSRHFFTKHEVMEYIDIMAKYKFNVLHWHLTDDNGWRIEIKSLPRLTEVGAWRVERYGRFGDRKEPQPGEPTPYGGYYTQDDIREVVAYAQKRNVTIVPEIDVPGHSMAALAAYPELSCRKEPKMVNPGTSFSEWYGNGKFKMLIENTLNPSDEKVYEFLDKVFAEVAQLFPSDYIHVGGDEAYHGFWEADANCQALMKKNKLKDGHELQSYFMKRVEKIITQHGKKMIGWDEILEGGLAPGATVMSWRGMKGGIEAAKLGHEVVMSPTTYAYLDYTQGDRSIEIPIYASLSLRKSYEFEPVPEGVDKKYILGGQGNLWTEQIPTLQHAFYMTYPRALAISECVWSPGETKSYDRFLGRLESHFQKFKRLDVSISPAMYDPIIQVSRKNDKLMCELSCDMEGSLLYYTIDNTFPSKHTLLYSKPFEIPEGQLSLKVICIRNGEQSGRMLSIPRDELLKRVAR